MDKTRVDKICSVVFSIIFVFGSNWFIERSVMET